MAIVSSLQMWGLVHSLTLWRSSSGEHFFGLRPNDPTADRFTGCEIAGFTFLLLVITIQSNLLAARSAKPFFMLSRKKDDFGHYINMPPPSMYVVISILVSTLIATFIAVYWNQDIVLGSGFGMAG